MPLDAPLTRSEDALPAEILEVTAGQARIEEPSSNGEVLSVSEAAKLAEAEKREKYFEAAREKYKGQLGIILYPPIDYAERTVDFISIDISKLKGADLKAIGREFKARYKPASNESYFFDNNYLILVFARINKLEEGFFDKLDGATYLGLTEFYKIQMKQVLGE